MKALILCSLILLLSGCVSEAEKAKAAKADSFATAIRAKSGQQWTVMKYGSEQEGYIVLRNDTTGVFHAFNTAKWDGTSYASFEAVAVQGDVLSPLILRTETKKSTDAQGNVEYWDYEYYTYGALRFSNTSSGSKDLEKIGALREEVAVKYLSTKLKSEFSLSNTRADELAKLTARYQRLESRRALTESEKNVFAMNALGVSMTQVERAMKKKANGNDDEYEDMLETAAKVNRTTPEQVGRFFDELAGNL